MRALVTGGAGFIGSHIVDRLLEEGHEARVYDNFASGKRENLAHLGGHVEVIEADLRDPARLEAAARGCDLVFHQAAIVSVPYSVEHPEETHDVNLQGTLNVLQAAKKAGVRRVVFASSAAVYGEEPALPKTEDMRLAPVSPYGVEKMTGEHYLSVWSKLFAIETVALRYFNVFGPRQDPSSAYSGVISVFVDRAMKKLPLTIFGDGEQYRDFVFVSDVASVNWLAATRPSVSGGVFNVGRGERTSLNELARLLGELVGRDLAPSHAAPRAGDIRESLADIGRARDELGFAPAVPVREGLSRLLRSLG